MKIYLENKDRAIEESPCETDLLFETDKYLYDDNIIEYKNQTYVICCINVQNTWAEVRPIRLDLDKDLTTYESNLTCPVCGYNIDICDLGSNWMNGEIFCPYCNTQLEYNADITWGASIKKLPYIVKIDKE